MCVYKICGIFDFDFRFSKFLVFVQGSLYPAVRLGGDLPDGQRVEIGRYVGEIFGRRRGGGIKEYVVSRFCVRTAKKVSPNLRS
jgi:hypothetical protein